jgi:hypothetical protein
MNDEYEANREVINLLPPKQWAGYEPENLIKLSYEKAWKLVREFPDCVGFIPHATSEMQTFALNKCCTLLFESVRWIIDLEAVAPRSTAWALRFANEYAASRDIAPFGYAVRMILEKSWESRCTSKGFTPASVPYAHYQAVVCVQHSLLRQLTLSSTTIAGA